MLLFPFSLELIIIFFRRRKDTKLVTFNYNIKVLIIIGNNTREMVDNLISSRKGSTNAIDTNWISCCKIQDMTDEMSPIAPWFFSY